MLPHIPNLAGGGARVVSPSQFTHIMSIKIDGLAFRAGGRPRSAVGEYAMKVHIFSFSGAFALAGFLGSAQSLAQNAYITNLGSNSVSVIDTATNTVTATIPVGAGPTSLGLFIQPAPRFAGTPGKANCYGKSVSALVRQYKGLNAAAAALGFPSVQALQNAILAFCEGDR